MRIRSPLGQVTIQSRTGFSNVKVGGCAQSCLVHLYRGRKCEKERGSQRTPMA